MNVARYCTTCDLVLPDGVPDGSLEITSGKTSTYRFANGELHHLRKVKAQRKKPATPVVQEMHNEEPI